MKQSTLMALERYAKKKIPTGDFLYAVLTNDLKESFMRADDENKRDLEEIVAYCYNHLPAISWGSVEEVGKWLNSRDEGGEKQCV